MQTKNDKIEILDACSYEDEGFTEGDASFGKAIATFNFGSASASQTGSEQSPAGITLSRGLTPPVNGEQFTIKRCYQFRPSTIRKLNEIKAYHDDINVYLNTILDEAIMHYYEHIFSNKI